MMEINKLPAEMLLEVHRRLTPSALKKAVLVDKLWRDVGQDPALWEFCKVAVYTKEDINNLSIKRLKNIQEILINPENWDVDDWEAFFRAVGEFSSLKKIDGLGRWTSRSSLYLVEPDLFARSLAKLEDVVVRGCTYDQIQALFTEMSSTTQVKIFHLSSGDLSQMDPGLFARVLSRLENLQLDVKNTTKDQMQALFTEIMNSSLKRLVLLDDFCEDMWRHLEPRFFAKVLSAIEDVSLTFYDGEASDHMEALFIELSFGTQMKRLRLEGADLSEFEPALLANALSKLEELRLLEGTFISTDHIRALFTEISLRTQMKKIALEYVGLSELDPGLFARVIVMLEDVDLISSNTTTDQMMELFMEMSHKSHLKSLNISHVDLTRVDPEVFAKAVTRLETLILNGTPITNDQVVSLFSEMPRNTVMKKIDLADYYFTVSSIAPEVLASALIRLEEVKAMECYITDDQAKTLFREMAQNSQNCNLEKLSLRGGDFSVVDPEDLAKAVTNMKEVCLRDSDLSTEQITSIFTHVLEGEKKLRKLYLGGILGAAANVNQEIVRKVKIKLKGEFVFP